MCVCVVCVCVCVLPLDLRDYEFLAFCYSNNLSMGITGSEKPELQGKIYHREGMAVILASLCFAILNC